MAKLDSTIENIRLITTEELGDLGCAEFGYCDEATKWLYPSSYWTSSPHTNSNFAWYVANFGGVFYDRYSIDYKYGIRPVIEISKSVFE